MTVSSLNIKIKSLLESHFMHILVEGEVASATYHTSGHLYFSVKDKESSIKCVMWRSSVAKMKFKIEAGMHIVIEGSLGVYTPRGEYQFYAVHIEPYGQGALALAFEQLKKKLKEKGYFEAERKQAIPKHVQKIALVTAKESAALHDMLKIIEKRWPLLEVFIVDVLVQGESAPDSISRGIRYADSLNVDVVVVGRGGGSTEDLWAFNSEAVADAVYAVKTPIVSAVGHEVDTMISDFVADLRAPTPSAAIEMILPDKQELMYVLDEKIERFQGIIFQKLAQLEQAILHAKEIFSRSSPALKLEDSNMEFERQSIEFKRVIEQKIEHSLSRLPELEKSFTQSIHFTLQQKEQYVEYINKKLTMNDPRKQHRKGWSQVSLNGKTIALEKLNVNDKFILEDATARIEAVCQKKV